MKFEDTPLYKYLDAREYKVTLADGRIIKSEGWIKRWENEFNKEHIPHVPKKMEIKKRGRK